MGRRQQAPWCPSAPLARNATTTKPFFLAAAIHARFRRDDPAGLTATDLAHWLAYHRYAGVDKVYVHDCHALDGEAFGAHPAIRRAVAAGYVDYVDWGAAARANLDARGLPRRTHVRAVQLPSVEDAQRRCLGAARWLALADVDEYFFVAGDAAPGFLARAVRGASRVVRRGRPVKVSQLLWRSVVAEGPRDAARGPMLAQQVPRLRDAAHNRSEAATKQVVRVDAVARHNVHRSDVSFGATVALPRAGGAFLKHYHGGRSVGFREWGDVDESTRSALLARTAPDACAACAAVADACLREAGRDADAPSFLVVGAALLLTARALRALLRRR